MEELKSWGLLLLYISAGSLIYCFLLPSGGVSKTAKSVISLCVTVSLALPLFNSLGKLKGIDFTFEVPTEIRKYDDFVMLSAENAIEELIKENVLKFTNVPYKTDIIIDKVEDGSINIGYVGLIFSSKPLREDELREALFQVLGVPVNISVESLSE